MKTSKKSKQTQRTLMDRKIKPWIAVRNDLSPPSGWIKAVRGSLGLSARQLGEPLGIQASSISQFEESEPEGKVTLHTMQKLANAMRCRFVYAILPEEPFESLDSLLDDQATQAARDIAGQVGHTMRLEKQGIGLEQSNEQVIELAGLLKAKMDSSIWDGRNLKRKKTK
jgi:predicted DNA-binding mobile mystery protein A